MLFNVWWSALIFIPITTKRWYVKVPVFSFNKIHGLDAYLSPEMKSTGEAIGYDSTLNRAFYKALQASGMKIQNYGTVFATIKIVFVFDINLFSFIK